MNTDTIVIAGIARTPMGGLLGSLAPASATVLGSVAVKAAVQRAGCDPALIQRIYMGCVLPAGLGQAPARQAALGASLPNSIEATTVNKMCGSGMQAAIMACETLAAGGADIVIAGGMESMSNAPYLLAKHRQGARAGHDRIADSMFLDGLEDAYQTGTPMGTLAEDNARNYGFTREEQDAYAIESLSRTNAAIANGSFTPEIAPVTLTTRAGEEEVSVDEQPGKARLDRIPTLKPAFVEGGTITAANASSISDGAAALVLTRASVAQQQGMQILAEVTATAAHAHDPGLFPTAPVPAMRKAMDKAGWDVNDVDLFEVNEAFAAVAMIAMHDLAIPYDKINVNGGACALGHPIGASGARILVTLLSALEQRGLKRGVAGICIGGGEATAMAIERV